MNEKKNWNMRHSTIHQKFYNVWPTNFVKKKSRIEAGVQIHESYLVPPGQKSNWRPQGWFERVLPPS
jgi:hypothetical protein